MAETAFDFNSNFLKWEAEFVADTLFQGVTTGEEMPLAFREIIARIPDLDDKDERWRFSWDNLEDDLREADGNDLDEEDIEALKQITVDFLVNIDTPENLETAAHMFLAASLGEDFTLPKGTTALDQLPVFAMKSRMAAITRPDGDDAPLMGNDTEPYEIDRAEVFEPDSQAFIEALGSALSAIQEDMRIIGQEPPLGSNKFFDPQGLVDHGTVRDKIIDRFIDDLDESPQLNEIRELSGTERYEALSTYINTLDDAYPPKNYYRQVMETLGPDADGVALVTLAHEYGVASEMDINRTILNSLHEVGADRSGMIGPEMTQHLEAYLETILDENGAGFGDQEMANRAHGFKDVYEIYLSLPQEQRDQINEALEARSGDAPGVLPPLTREEREERRQDQERREEMPEDERGRLSVLENAAGVMGFSPDIIIGMDSLRTIEGVAYAHLDEGFEREMREIFSDNLVEIYGRRDPMSASPSDRIGGDMNLWRFRFPEDGVAYEYRISPSTGDITKLRVTQDANGNELLVDTVSADDNTPISLEGDNPNFNIFHPNLISQKLLERLTERRWQQLVEDEKLDEIYTRMPEVGEVDQGLEYLQEQIKNNIRALQPDISDEEMDELYADITSNEYSFQQLKERLRAPDSSRDNVLEINTFLSQMNALNQFRDLASMRDYTNYTVLGLLPGGIDAGRPRMDAPWEQNLDNLFERGEFRWERATEFRTLPPDCYTSLNSNGTTNVSMYEGNDYALSYIEEQGWSGTLDTIQTGMVARALMIKEAVDRSNSHLEPGEEPITDLNSDEARAAFLNDFQAGYYNLHDVEVMMRSFDSFGGARANRRADGENYAFRPGQYNDADDIRHRASFFHQMFKQPVELTLEDGSARVVESTITRDDAVRMFWRDYTERREFGYDKSMYQMGYDEMVAEHGDAFVNRIQYIMENSTEYQRGMLRDANNPEGDFKTEYIRNYQALYEQRAEMEYKDENEVIAIPESVVADPTLDDNYDRVTPMPAPAAEEEREAANGNVTPADLAAAANDITAPSPEVVAAMQGGVTPQVTPTAIPGAAV